MQIEKNKVVTFHYRLSEEGKEGIIETSHGADPMVYLHGRGGILAGLEKAMDGRQSSDQFTLSLPPEQTYGLRQPGEPQRIPIKHLAGKHRKLKPGQMVAVNTKDGPRDVTIVKVGKFNVDVDTNHPLAGKMLVFDIDIIDVRDATEEELAHGHAHAPGAHPH
jgi:FKBP-type peptidyl-prolyl cis-trans isomerase SlyD